jgi:hypothetical protein
MEGSLSEQMEQSIQLLKQNVWHIPKIQGTKREDVPAYQDIVLREVIINSLVPVFIDNQNSFTAILSAPKVFPRLFFKEAQ